MNRKIRQGLVGITLSSILFTGCQKNPESSIVVNKDFDKMIEQAENTDGSSTEVADLADNYDTYKTTIKDDEMHVEVNIDAKVDIPKTEKLSVYRVKQKEINQEFLDKVRTTLIGDKQLYDGIIGSIETKAVIEKNIQGFKDEIDNVKNSSDYSEEDKEVYINDYQMSIDKLQQSYEQAPDEISFDSYPSDYKFHSVSSLYEADSTNSYYEWQHGLNPDGEIYFGVSDGKDGNYDFLYAQNNANYGNRLHYRTSKFGPIYTTPVIGTSGFNGKMVDYSNVIWKVGEKPDSEYITNNDIKLEDEASEKVTISEEAALDKASKFLNSIGLTDYDLYIGGLYNDYINCQSKDEKERYREEYIFGFRRNINGVFACNEGDGKFADSYQGDNYVKKLWDGEGITVIVNDDGIVGFDLCIPLEITETVVDMAAIKGFEEIKNTFEDMIVAIGASNNEDLSAKFDINRVVLRYTRISEPDSFDTGLLVPTWEFIGKMSGSIKERYYEDTDDDRIVMSINAIDGSVINQELGY